MAGTLQMLSGIAFVVAGLLLVLSVVLFIVLKIPQVAGDLSGRTARRSIESARRINEKRDAKGFRTDPLNASRGKITAGMQGQSTWAQPQERKPLPGLDDLQTGLLGADQVPRPLSSGGTPAMEMAEETTWLGETAGNIEEETERLPAAVLKESEETTLLQGPGGEETELLSDSYDITTLLQDTNYDPRLTMIDDIVIVHTNEFI